MSNRIFDQTPEGKPIIEDDLSGAVAALLEKNNTVRCDMLGVRASGKPNFQQRRLVRPRRRLDLHRLGDLPLGRRHHVRGAADRHPFPLARAERADARRAARLGGLVRAAGQPGRWHRYDGASLTHGLKKAAGIAPGGLDFGLEGADQAARSRSTYCRMPPLR